MIVEPERYLADFASAGADVIIVHQEATLHLHRIVRADSPAGQKGGRGAQPVDSRGHAG